MNIFPRVRFRSYETLKLVVCHYFPRNTFCRNTNRRRNLARNVSAPSRSVYYIHFT